MSAGGEALQPAVVRTPAHATDPHLQSDSTSHPAGRSRGPPPRPTDVPLAQLGMAMMADSALHREPAADAIAMPFSRPLESARRRRSLSS